MATATQPPTSPVAPAAASPTIYLFTVKQYQLMEEVGVFDGDRVEMLEGQVIRIGPMNAPHIQAVSRMRRQLEPRMPQGFYLRVQADIALTSSQPLPDGAVVLGTSDDDYPIHPVPTDVRLVIEVADSSLSVDRTSKLRMYAADLIPVYWIVNIPDRQLEVYAQPVAGHTPQYRQRQDLAETDTVTFTLGTHTVGPIAVRDLLPPA